MAGNQEDFSARSDLYGETRPNPTSYRVVKHAYGTEPQQYGELSIPVETATKEPHPVVILIHGGFWRSPYDLTLMNKLAHHLARQGIAVWNIDYRRIGDPGGAWPGTFEDVAHAADALIQLADDYTLDLQRAVAVGHSAGGQLALWLASRPHLTPENFFFPSTPALTLAGVISQAGVNDLHLAWQWGLGNDAVAELLQGSPADVPLRYSATSPAALLPLGIPQVLIHGDQDNRVPLEISERYAHTAHEAGDPVTLIELPGADHFVVIDSTLDEGEYTIEAVHALLHQDAAAVGWLAQLRAEEASLLQRKRISNLMSAYLLRVVIQDDLDQQALDYLRAQLNLPHHSRLEDSEDEDFGTSTLTKDTETSLTLQLLRNQDFRSPSSWTWTCELSYDGTRPPAAQIDHWRTQILQAITNAGLRIRKVYRW